MGKLYGNTPSTYFELENEYLNCAIDFACAAAFWEDENFHYKESQKTAEGEASSIDQVLEEYRNNR